MRNLSVAQYEKEGDLVADCLKFLTLRGHFVWRNNTGAVQTNYRDKDGQEHKRFWRAGTVGSSDIVGISKKGRFIAIECKLWPKKPTSHQVLFLSEIHARGGLAIVAYGLSDLEKGGL